MGLIEMAKYDGIVGQEVLSVEDEDNGITIVFRDNRFLFVKVVDGKLQTESVPE